ncbi:hypothetical protein BGW42_005392 [Actinomortierella wolfii]|nr:hypothetical protein BGW42_005392 [Actinomortierella wolfii]
MLLDLGSTVWTLIGKVFEGSNSNIGKPDFLLRRAILCSKSNEMGGMNDIVSSNMTLGESIFNCLMRDQYCMLVTND